MGTLRIGFRLLAVLTLLGALTRVSFADPPPSAAKLLEYVPIQKGVDVTTPTAGEVSTCTVDLEKGKPLPGDKVPTAWVVKDAAGRVVRKFHDTTGNGGVNAIAYYKDGEEVYRELVVGGKINQFRWVGAAGSKWGVDLNGDGKIGSWTVISPEEVSQEALAAILTKDQKRLEALLITKAELDALGLPAAEVQKIQTKLTAVSSTFDKTCKDLKGLKLTTQWIHLDLKAPQAIPADGIDSKNDVMRYRNAGLLYQDGNGQGAKADWIQLGDLIQVGKAWRLVQAPAPGMTGPDVETVKGPGSNDTGVIHIPEGAEAFVKKLNELDEKGPKPGQDGIIEFNLQRAAVLEQIARLYTKAEDGPKRDVWIKQVADCYASAAQQGDSAALKRLGEWREVLGRNSPILPYIVFREISADFAQKLAKVGRDVDKLTKLQEDWKTKLSKYVAEYPKTDDTPDAILQLGMVNEYFGSKMEGEAKQAYELLLKNFPKHSLAPRAQGCLDRLSMEGKQFNLTGPTLDGKTFDINAYQGKAVVVYYWASWNDPAADFNKINMALAGVAGKAEFVGVNLDNKATDAIGFLKANPMNGVQLFMPGGLDSPLAVRHGIMSLPVMFLIGPDGKGVSRHVGATNIDDELRRLLKVPDKDNKDK